VQAEMLLLRIEKQGKNVMIETKAPHYFETVLACSLLQKMCCTLLPKFQNVLKPVCNLIFRGIFRDFPKLDRLKINAEDQEDQKISSLPFINYKAFFDNERVLHDEKIITDT
jgi:hypothetical protein